MQKKKLKARDSPISPRLKEHSLTTDYHTNTSLANPSPSLSGRGERKIVRPLPSFLRGRRGSGDTAGGKRQATPPRGVKKNFFGVSGDNLRERWWWKSEHNNAAVVCPPGQWKETRISFSEQCNICRACFKHVVLGRNSTNGLMKQKCLPDIESMPSQLWHRDGCQTSAAALVCSESFGVGAFFCLNSQPSSLFVLNFLSAARRSLDCPPSFNLSCQQTEDTAVFVIAAPLFRV